MLSAPTRHHGRRSRTGTDGWRRARPGCRAPAGELGRGRVTLGVTRVTRPGLRQPPSLCAGGAG
jgi:hypothetical protein